MEISLYEIVGAVLKDNEKQPNGKGGMTFNFVFKDTKDDKEMDYQFGAPSTSAQYLFKAITPFIRMFDGNNYLGQNIYIATENDKIIAFYKPKHFENTKELHFREFDSMYVVGYAYGYSLINDLPCVIAGKPYDEKENKRVIDAFNDYFKLRQAYDNVPNSNKVFALKKQSN